MLAKGCSTGPSTRHALPTGSGDLPSLPLSPPALLPSSLDMVFSPTSSLASDGKTWGRGPHLSQDDPLKCGTQAGWTGRGTHGVGPHKAAFKEWLVGPWLGVGRALGGSKL